MFALFLFLIKVFLAVVTVVSINIFYKLLKNYEIRLVNPEDHYFSWIDGVIKEKYNNGHFIPVRIMLYRGAPDIFGINIVRDDGDESECTGTGSDLGKVLEYIGKKYPHTNIEVYYNHIKISL